MENTYISRILRYLIICFGYNPDSNLHTSSNNLDIFNYNIKFMIENPNELFSSSENKKSISHFQIFSVGVITLLNCNILKS